MTRRRAGRWYGFPAQAAIASILAIACLSPLAGAASASAGKSGPTEVRAAVGLPPTHPVVADGWRAFEQAATDAQPNSLSFRLFVTGALLGASGGIEPLVQGDADLGLVVPARYPDQFPYTGYVTELALTGDRGLVAAAAMTEQILLGCKPCADEFLEQGLVFLGTYSAPPYLLISTRKIATAAALHGIPVQTPGSVWDRWVASLGARPVHPEAGGASLGPDPGRPSAAASIDVAGALSQPSRDGTARYVTRLGLGGYRGASPFTVSRTFWNGLAPAQRRALLGAAAAGIVAATNAYEAQAEAVLTEAQDRGVTLVSADPAFAAAVRAIADQDGERAAAAARDREGIVDAVEILSQYRSLYVKYAGLFRAAPTPEEQTRILTREIFAKLDPATYAAIPPTDEAKAKKK